MKKTNTFLISLIIIGLFACAPKKDQTKEMASDNNEKIEELLVQIKTLKEQLDNSIETETIQTTDKQELTNLRGSIDELRTDLLRYIKQVKTNLDKRITGLEDKYSSFKKTLDDTRNTYVKLEDFQVLKQDIINNYRTRSEVITAEISTAKSSKEIQKIHERLNELDQKQNNFTTEYKIYFHKALALWDKRLKSYITNEIEISDKKFQIFVANEVTRLTIEIENNTNKIKHKQAILSDSYAAIDNERRISLENEVSIIERAIITNKNLLSSIKEETQKSQLPQIFQDIMKKNYAPCFNGLKNSPHCFTVGSMITRLGGIFVDSSKFKRTKNDFLRYLTLSGLKNSPIVQDPDSFIVPDSKNKKHYEICHPGDDEYLLPEPELWPRGVLLALILQNIEDDLETQKRLNIVSSNVRPVTGIVAWYRTKCYQNRIKGITTTDKTKWTKSGDHIYAAAFDLKFSDQDNTETHAFYVKYVKEQIIENDIFEVTHPLKSANFNIYLGFGHGANSRLHLGVTSEQARWTPEFKY